MISLGIIFFVEQGRNEHGPWACLRPTDLGRKLLHRVVDVVALLAQDTHLIVDEVLFDGRNMSDYRQALSLHQVYAVRVDCDLDMMQEREFLRQDRMVGLANGQHQQVHVGSSYDFHVDTSQASSFVLAQLILQKFSEET